MRCVGSHYPVASPLALLGEGGAGDGGGVRGDTNMRLV